MEITTPGIPAPHPRSCTTDDVECFFSIMRASIGKDFTPKQVCCLTLFLTEFGNVSVYNNIIGVL